MTGAHPVTVAPLVSFIILAVHFAELSNEMKYNRRFNIKNEKP